MRRTICDTYTASSVVSDASIDTKHRLIVTCALRTIAQDRRISRWEHEAILEPMQVRLDRNQDEMRVRRSISSVP
jgi:hypothetical protein